MGQNVLAALWPSVSQLLFSLSQGLLDSATMQSIACSIGTVYFPEDSLSISLSFMRV